MPEPINYQSALPAILEAGKYLAGSKTDTKQTTTAQTQPLEQLLGGMNPQALEALVASLFSQGAAQVPGLTSQFANATGSRVTNNSMLAQSLAQLNQSLAQSIANAAVQQQQTAVQGATGLANATKATSQQQRTAPGSLGRAAAPTVIGFGLNRVGKMLDANKAGVGAGVPDVASNVETFEQPFDVAASFPGESAGAMAPDFSSVGGFDTGYIDALGALDLGGAAGAGYDAFSAFDDYSDFGGGFEDAIDWGSVFGFADGGKIKDDYADGGNVIRNRPNYGIPTPRVTTPLARTMPPTPAPRRQRTQQTGSGEVDPGMIGGTTAAPSGGVAGIGTAPGIGIGQGLGLGIAAAQGAPMSALMAMAIPAIVTKSIIDMLFGAPAVGMPPAMTPSVAETFGLEDMGFETEGSPAGPGEGSVGVADADAGVGVGPASSGVGEGDAGVGDGGAGDGGDGGDGGFADGGQVRGGTKMLNRWGQKKDYVPGPREEGTTKKKPSMKTDDRFIRGEGTSTSDSVNVNASVDEYILPASTVAALGGPDVLDSIVAATHRPASGGTRG